jgi:hypothetical protein
VRHARLLGTGRSRGTLAQEQNYGGRFTFPGGPDSVDRGDARPGLDRSVAGVYRPAVAGGKKRAFLAPVAVAVAALLPQAQAGAAETRTAPAEHSGGVADEPVSKRLRRSLEAVNRPSVGSGRHLEHASHASHDSHMSHVSGAGEIPEPGDTPVQPVLPPPTEPPTTTTTLPPVTAPAVFRLSATLDPAEVVPAPKHVKAGTAGTLSGTLELGEFRWSASLRHLTGRAAFVRLRQGAPGSNGRVVATFCKNCSTSPRGVVTLSSPDSDLLRGGQLYVEVTTKKNSKGEIRGQVSLAG